MSDGAEEREVDRAIERFGLASALEKLPPVAARRALDAIRGVFITGNPRVLWLGLTPPIRSAPYANEDWPASLLRACAEVQAASAWLVLESSGQLPVYRCAAVDAVARVLSECSFLEYYLVDESLQWFVADTDHDEILVATR